MQVREGDTVAIHFTASLEDKTIIESTDSTQPLTFTQGEGHVLPAVEQAVIGMTPGETKTVHVPERDAFGPYNPDLVVQLDRSEFDQRGIQPKMGLEIETKQADGAPLVVRVTDISAEKITMDANHPLAGHSLTYDLVLARID